MAGKARKRISPAQAERLRVIKVTRDNAEKAMNVHLRICHYCHIRGPAFAEYCDEGGILARARAKARYEFAYPDGPEYGAPKQLPMF